MFAKTLFDNLKQSTQKNGVVVRLLIDKLDGNRYQFFSL